MPQDRMEPLPPPTAPAAPDPAVAALQARLGLPLADHALALSALTHKSFVNEHRGEGLQDNERLEFLGDAVIDLAVSHRLMELFPGAREGELSKIRAALVDEAALARLARELDLGPLLRLGRGEELTGGREKSSLLADAFEAVVAALYLEGGLPAILKLVDRFLGEAFQRAAAGTLDRDFKTQLQELSQSKLRSSPRYRVVAERGPDHSKVFEVVLELRGEVIGRGEGRSKKDAEQQAAKAGLGWMSEQGAEALAARAAAEGAPAATAPEPAAPEPAAPRAVAPEVPVPAPEPPAPPVVEPEPPIAPEPAPAEATAPAKRRAPRKATAREATSAAGRSRKAAGGVARQEQRRRSSKPAAE